MSNFWATSDGEDLSKNTETSYETQTSSDPLPDKSSVKVYIEKAAWATAYQSTERYINIQYSVVKPDAYENRKVFHKLWVAEPNPQWKPEDHKKKSDAAKRMLATIDANAGGKLARNAGIPDDDDLALALTNKQMVLKLGVWETDNGNTGNWVMGVSPKDHEVNVPDVAASVKKANKVIDDLDDDVPF